VTKLFKEEKMSASNISTSVNPVIAQRQQLLVEKERVMKEEMLLDEYERTQNAYQAMSDAAQVFEQKKAEYLQEEAQYETLGNSINMTTPINGNSLSNSASVSSPTQTAYPAANLAGNPEQGYYSQATAVNSTAPTQTAGGPLPIEANYNPNAAAYYGQGGSGAINNAPLPGEGMPYYQPLPSTSTPNASLSSSPSPSGVAPAPQGVPTQASLQQQAQQAPVTPADVAALRQILQMNPQTAQQASQVSDADLTKLLQSDPEIAGAVKEFEAMSSGQGVSPTGGQGGSTPPTSPTAQPTDPAQALKLAQQNPEVMKQAQAMVASLTPQERDAMMKQLANDPEAKAIMAQMGVSLPAQGTPAPAQKV
jgi:hypothetical protein